MTKELEQIIKAAQEKFYKEFGHLSVVKNEMSANQYKTIADFLSLIIPEAIAAAFKAQKVDRKFWKGWFEANYLDGDDIKDCGQCYFTTTDCLELILDVLQKVRERQEELLK